MTAQRSIKMKGGTVYFTADQLNDPRVFEFAVFPKLEATTVTNTPVDETTTFQKVTKDELQDALRKAQEGAP